MVRTILAALLVALVAASGGLRAADKDDFKPMFNGKDLSGWVILNGAPDTWKFQDTKDGPLLITTGKPISLLRSEKQYENFIIELEWKHMQVKGNSGLFLWSDPLPGVGSPFSSGIEVQILSDWNTETHTSHGDVFSVQRVKCVPDRPHPKGAMRCLPSENRCKPTGEWNHYRVEAKDGVVKLAVNGKVVSGVSECTTRKGYLCLEAEGSECHFRNLKIMELPGGNAKPEQTAAVDKGLRTIFSGLSLDGWKVEDGHKDHWVVKDGKIVYDGKSTAKDPNLWTEKEYGDFEMMVDWRFTAKPKKVKRQVILPSGEVELGDDKKPKEVEVDDAGDSGVYLRGSSKSQVNMWCWPIGSGEVYGYRTDAKMSPEVRKGVTPTEKADKPIGQWNRFIITMKGDRLTVNLNGKTVIENAQLPGVAEKGRIALQHHGDPIEFTNLFIRELK